MPGQELPPATAGKRESVRNVEFLNIRFAPVILLARNNVHPCLAVGLLVYPFLAAPSVGLHLSPLGAYGPMFPIAFKRRHPGPFLHKSDTLRSWGTKKTCRDYKFSIRPGNFTDVKPGTPCLDQPVLYRPVWSCHLSDYLFSHWGRKNRNFASRLIGDAQDHVWPRTPHTHTHGVVGKRKTEKFFEILSWAWEFTEFYWLKTRYLPVLDRPVMTSPVLSCHLSDYAFRLWGRKSRYFVSHVSGDIQGNVWKSNPPGEVGELKNFRNFEISEFPNFRFAPVILLA